MVSVVMNILKFLYAGSLDDLDSSKKKIVYSNFIGMKSLQKKLTLTYL